MWRECQGNHSRAARILDIDRTTLYNKLRRYGLRT
ncbi:MAG TPA: helix-turn-helix domain-containing protein [Bryobacteraceae bacterium]|nr:helix-turn-helix domain-containing protein [Bryobacteraceae bacterium]